MQDPPPSPAPLSPATVAPAAEGMPPRPLLVALGSRARRLFAAFLAWPGGQWPAPTVVSLFFCALLIVAAVELVPKGLSDVTLTVRARTEVLEIELQPERTYVWWLPAGSYSLLTAKNDAGCERRDRFDLACTYAEPTALTIKHGATARFEVTAAEGETAPRFSVSLTPRAAHTGSGAAAGKDASADATSAFAVSGAGAAIETHDLVTFESQPAEHWRIPLIAERVQIGEFLSDGIAADDALGLAARQPIMTAGDVRMFARSIGQEERYQIHEERFDPADVVQIPADAGREGLLLGLLSLDAGDARAFDLTLHTDLAEVFVRRLGAQHRIGISTWSILSNLPLWLAMWVVWASLIVVANYYAARLQVRGSAP